MTTLFRARIAMHGTTPLYDPIFDLRDDLRRAFANDDEQDTDLLTEGIGLYRKDYVRRGPNGLAPRTYTWAAEIPSLLEAWRRGMAHLREANVLATPVFDLGHVGSWKRGTSVRRRSDR